MHFPSRTAASTGSSTRIADTTAPLHRRRTHSARELPSRFASSRHRSSSLVGTRSLNVMSFMDLWVQMWVQGEAKPAMQQKGGHPRGDLPPTPSDGTPIKSLRPILSHYVN